MEILGVVNNEYRNLMRQVFLDYINSKEWKAVIKAVRIRDFNQCQDCGELRRKLIVHHTDYRNWGYGDLREINDCILVCGKCHIKRHRNFSVDVPFWASQRDEISPEIFFNKREEELSYHPFRGKEAKLI